MSKSKATSHLRLVCAAASVVASITGHAAAQPGASAPAPLIGGPVSQGLRAAEPTGTGPGDVDVSAPTPAQPATSPVVHSDATTIAAAVAAGDLQRLIELGGTAQDVVAAMRGMVARDPAAKFVRPDGRATGSVGDALQHLDSGARWGFVPVLGHMGSGSTVYLAYGPPDGLKHSLNIVADTPPSGPVGESLPEGNTPDEDIVMRSLRALVFIPNSLEESIAIGSNQGIRYYGGSQLDLRLSSIATNEANRASALARGDTAQAANLQRQIDTTKMDIAANGETLAKQTAGAWVAVPLSLDGMRAARAAGQPYADVY